MTGYPLDPLFKANTYPQSAWSITPRIPSYGIIHKSLVLSIYGSLALLAPNYWPRTNSRRTLKAHLDVCQSRHLRSMFTFKKTRWCQWKPHYHTHKTNKNRWRVKEVTVTEQGAEFLPGCFCFQDLSCVWKLLSSSSTYWITDNLG